MPRRATRPLDPAAVRAADNEIYRRHEADPRPNPLFDGAGHRRPLSATDPAQTELRREWMDLYVESGGHVENTSPDPTPPEHILATCPGSPPPNPPPTPPPPAILPAVVPPPTQTPAPTANLHVQLQHACDRSPLNNGTVRITGPESRELRTGADGWANFNGITPGDYRIEGTHPQHYQSVTSAHAPDATTTAVQLPLQAEIHMAAAQAAYTVVLDANGNAPAAFPIAEFRITNGPPNHFFDVQLSRDGAGTLSGGPGLAASWVQADGRDARMGRTVFSSWANGQRTLRLDGGGNATFRMPLEWWRDQARQRLSAFTEFTYHFRVVAFRDATTPVCAYSAASSVALRNNLVRFRVVDNGYINGGTAKSIRMEFTVREANTTDMYTFVQWMQGFFRQWSGYPPVMSYPSHQLYGIIHDANFPDFTIDRLETNPRYWGGAYNHSADGLTASATDAPSAPLPPASSHGWGSIDFETRAHLNFEVPAAVTIRRQDGAAPVYGVITGALADPQPITLDSSSWNTRVLQVRQADGTVTVTHPANFAGP